MAKILKKIRRRRGRPATRVIKIDATMEEVARRIFANAKKPDPSIRLYNRPENDEGRDG